MTAPSYMIIFNFSFPFSIEIALTDIQELNKKIQDLTHDRQNQVNTIQQLLEENLKLNSSLRGLQYIPSTRQRAKAGSLQNQYCMQNDCYTPTEFALFGIGICIAGILIGVIVLAYVKNKCSAEDKLYEYTLDDTHQVSTYFFSFRGKSLLELWGTTFLPD